VPGMFSSLEVKVFYPTWWRWRISEAQGLPLEGGPKEAWSKSASRWTKIGYQAWAWDERPTYRKVHIHQARGA